jgi:threonine dehydrogenase-like Zn-dependent dehydrogenase
MVAMASSWPSGDMTALVFPRANEVAWQTVSIPEPAPRHVLVRIDRLGICGTDVHLFTGDIAYMQNGLSRYPFRPGHEWCGTVAAVAEGVTNVAVGDRVVGEPFLSCGRCSLCLRGKRNHCPNRDELGVRGDSPGAAENVAKIAEHIDPAHAVLCEPLVTVLHALSVTRLEPGERIAVMGAGTLGLLAVQVAKAMGAVVDVLGVSDRMWLALENGAEQFLRVDDAVPETYDVVIEASGAATSLALAVRIASPAGRIAQVGMPAASTIPVDAVAIVTKGLQINGVLGGIPFLPRAVTLLENGVVRPELLIDRVLSWHEYERALNLIMDRTMKRPKIILDFESISREASA